MTKDTELIYDEWAAKPHSKILIGKAMDGRMRDIDIEQIFKDGFEAGQRSNADSARLDWLQEQPEFILRRGNYMGLELYANLKMSTDTQDIREAIDASHAGEW